MRIALLCAECAKATSGIGAWFTATIREDGLYTGKCPNGHDLLLATQTLPHEMLFDIALNAIVDRYHRDAVSSFAAAIERFFEYATRVIAKKRQVPAEKFTEAWKEVAQQSERQLGAYIFLWLVEFGSAPDLLSNSMTKLRNAVVHKGRLPERSDAIAFGEAAYKVIQEGVRKLRATHLDDMNKTMVEYMAPTVEKMGPRYPRGFQVTSTALNVIEDISTGYKPFGQILIERDIK
jgi:hypothetical protein